MPNNAQIALISHASKVMLKILQARLQQYVNDELPDVQAGFRKRRGTKDQIASIVWIIKTARELEKNICICFIDYWNDAEAETPVLRPPHAKSWLIGKDSDAGRDWGQEEKGTTEDEMAGWHHWLDGRESEWTLGVGVGQPGLACCDSWGRKESDTTEQLNWTELNCVFVNPNLLISLPAPTVWKVTFIYDLQWVPVQRGPLGDWARLMGVQMQAERQLHVCDKKGTRRIMEGWGGW